VATAVVDRRLPPTRHNPEGARSSKLSPVIIWRSDAAEFVHLRWGLKPRGPHDVGPPAPLRSTGIRQPLPRPDDRFHDPRDPGRGRGRWRVGIVRLTLPSFRNPIKPCFTHSPPPPSNQQASRSGTSAALLVR